MDDFIRDLIQALNEIVRIIDNFFMSICKCGQQEPETFEMISYPETPKLLYHVDEHYI